MIGKLVWHRTGDTLLLDITKPELFEYYVDQLNQHNANKFHSSTTFQANTIIESLKTNIYNIKKYKDKIPFEITNWDGDLLNQDYLNQLHCEWVKTGIKYPKISLLLKKMSSADTDYRGINLNIHALEECFNLDCRNYESDPWQCVNPFGTDVIDFDFGNLMLGFDNLGRSTWAKFRHRDYNVHDTDTNNYQMLSGLLNLNLDRPMFRSPPQNYVDWCKEHQVPVIGPQILIGNFVDIDTKLRDLRKIFTRNFNEQSDTFFLEI